MTIKSCHNLIYYPWIGDTKTLIGQKSFTMKLKIKKLKKKLWKYLVTMKKNVENEKK